MKKLFAILLPIFVVTILMAQPAQPTEMEKAENFFRTASVLTYNADYSPKDYVGSLIYYKPDRKDELIILKFNKINDSSIVQIPIDDILYQKVHTHEEVASAKFLGIFNSKVTNKHLLEVVLLRDYSLEAPSFISDAQLFEQIKKVSIPLINDGYNVEYVWKVNVNKLTSRIFKEGGIQAGLNYQAEVSGKTYFLSENFTKKQLITIQSNDVGIFLNIDILSKKMAISDKKEKKISDKNLDEEVVFGYEKNVPNNKNEYTADDYFVADKIKLVIAQ